MLLLEDHLSHLINLIWHKSQKLLHSSQRLKERTTVTWKKGGKASWFRATLARWSKQARADKRMNCLKRCRRCYVDMLKWGKSLPKVEWAHTWGHHIQLVTPCRIWLLFSLSLKKNSLFICGGVIPRKTRVEIWRAVKLTETWFNRVVLRLMIKTTLLWA